MTIETNEKDDKKADEIEIAEHQHATKIKKPVTSGFLYLSLALSIIALVFAGYNYRMIGSLKSDPGLIEKIDQFNRSLEILNRSISSVQSQQQQLEGSMIRLAEDQERSAQSLQSLYNDRNTDETSWSLAEVKHLINIANLRLSLERDIGTALAALQAADNRLAQLGDPELFDVRRLLTAEMNALRSIAPVDITGLSLYLTDMVSRVISLPLKAGTIVEDLNASASVDQNLPAWEKLLFSVWNEFKGMFSITRTGGNSSATLLPDEKYFLYQNLRLQLEAARLAVIRRDTKSLHESLQVIRVWLGDYFDMRDSGVVNILQAIDTMGQLELDPILPNVGSSLEALQIYMNNRSAGTTDSDADLP